MTQQKVYLLVTCMWADLKIDHHFIYWVFEERVNIEEYLLNNDKER